MRKRRNKGTVLVEFAVVLPLFILILIGTIEFGIVLHDFLILQNASREGARLGATGNSEAAIQQRVRDLALGMADANLNIQVTNAQGTRGSMVTVRATYPVPLLTGLMKSIVNSNTFSLQATSFMRLE